MKRGIIGILLALSFGWSASATSSTTNEFIRSCDVPVPSEDCIVEYLVSIAAGVKYKSCRPQVAQYDAKGTFRQEEVYAETRKQIRNVVSWLKSHPELGSKDPTEPIGAAAAAKYPCK